MIRSRVTLVAYAALIAVLSGCAAAGLEPTTSSMPIERQNMPPQYRVFYDALEGEGDWTLIEPYGYVFRPHVNFVAWHPYEYGFWVPSDVYGWVWISTETFGWATYHYGQWMYDDYQGWVWIPGLDWGPAWVNWEMSADYVSWAPILAQGSDPGAIPGGPRIWAPISALGSGDLASRVIHDDQIGVRNADARPLNDAVQRNGVVIHRGPPLERVESVTGPLQRVRLAEIGATPAMKSARRGETTTLTPAEFTAQIEATKKAADEAAREAQGYSSMSGALPARVSVVRPLILPAPHGTPPHTPPAVGHPAPPHAHAVADTTKH